MLVHSDMGDLARPAMKPAFAVEEAAKSPPRVKKETCHLWRSIIHAWISYLHPHKCACLNLALILVFVSRIDHALEATSPDCSNFWSPFATSST